MHNEKVERNEDIRKLRFEQCLKLETIAEIHGITKQRVQQIIGRSNVITKYVATKRKHKFTDIATNHLEMTNKQLSEMLGISVNKVSRYRPKTRHAIEPGSQVALGMEIEDKVADILTNMGFEVERQYVSAPFDLLVNGHRVNVKSAASSNDAPSQKHISPKWRWSLHGRNNCDLFIFVIIPTTEIFIIPEDHIPDNWMDMQFCHPTQYRTKQKWQSYQNRFNLLA